MGSELLTPEAVVLGFDTAGLPSRLLARALDVTLQVVLLIAALIGLGFLGGAGVPEVGLLIATLFIVPLLLLGYPIILESLWRGRTLGKAALGLRVVTIEGAPIRFRHALIRGGADIIDLYGLGVLLVAPGIIGTVAIAASKRSQRLGDIVAGTIVVRERTGATRPAPVSFTVPLGYESYAATVDVTGIDARDYQAVRSYLLRAHGLRVDARRQVSVDLARSISSRIRHSPPPGITPDLFLVVVAANVQGRGGERPAAVVAAAPVAGGWGAVPAWRGAGPLPSGVAAGGPSPVPTPSSPPAAGTFALPD